MKIYSYWEGFKPDYIQMCQEILTNRCQDIVFLSEAIEHTELSINLKVDYLKAKTIYENGGFWIDADMIVMKDLSSIFDLLDNNEYIGIPGFFGARKGASILKRWIDGMDKRILEGNLTFSDLIQPLLHDSEFSEFGVLTREMICPIYHLDFNEFFKEKKIEYNPYVVTLYNSQFPDWFKKMSRADILSKNWYISDFFRKAIQ